MLVEGGVVFFLHSSLNTKRRHEQLLPYSTVLPILLDFHEVKPWTEGPSYGSIVQARRRSAVGLAEAS